MPCLTTYLRSGGQSDRRQKGTNPLQHNMRLLWDTSRNASPEEIGVFSVKYCKRLRVRFPPPPLVVETIAVHLWPTLSRKKRDGVGLFHAQSRGQVWTRGASQRPKSNTSRNTSAEFYHENSPKFAVGRVVSPGGVNSRGTCR